MLTHLAPSRFCDSVKGVPDFDLTRCSALNSTVYSLTVPSLCEALQSLTIRSGCLLLVYGTEVGLERIFECSDIRPRSRCGCRDDMRPGPACSIACEAVQDDHPDQVCAYSCRGGNSVIGFGAADEGEAFLSMLAIILSRQ